MIRVWFGLTEIPVKTTTFPGGEVNVTLDHDGSPVPFFEDGFGDNNSSTRIKIKANLTDVKSVMELLLVTDAARRMAPHHEIDLMMPYVPYARQDRVCNEGEALSIKVFCDLINSQSYREVEIWDPHSDVTPALLNNVYIREPVEFFRQMKSDAWDSRTLFVAPDAGAIKKVTKLAALLSHSNDPIQVIRADKTRDTKTGALSGTVVYGDVVDRDVIIVDDLFDGGFTFVLLGKELKKMGAAHISLYVTHGIFSKGVDVLKGAVDRVRCPNPWLNNIAGKNSEGIFNENNWI